jgi:hypothetical protein
MSSIKRVVFLLAFVTSADPKGSFGKAFFGVAIILAFSAT